MAKVQGYDPRYNRSEPSIQTVSAGGAGRKLGAHCSYWQSRKPFSHLDASHVKWQRSEVSGVREWVPGNGKEGGKGWVPGQPTISPCLLEVLTLMCGAYMFCLCLFLHTRTCLNADTSGVSAAVGQRTLQDVSHTRWEGLQMFSFTLIRTME